MSFNIKNSGVVNTAKIKREDADETRELLASLDEARKFINSFHWCGEIVEEYHGFGVGGIIGVFLFKISPIGADIDEWIWVVVGDIPPAYISTQGNPTVADALQGYISEMSVWAKAAKHGDSVEELIPVNVPPTVDYALKLENRLTFLESKILPLVRRGKP